MYLFFGYLCAIRVCDPLLSSAREKADLVRIIKNCTQASQYPSIFWRKQHFAAGEDQLGAPQNPACVESSGLMLDS